MSISDSGRFSNPPVLILTSLAGGPRHGYAMMEDIADFSGTRLEPGTLYGAIARLEQKGWIEACPSADRKRPYRITAEGMTALKEQVRTLERVMNAGKHRLAISEG